MQVFFTGFFLLDADFPAYWGWYRYLAFVRFSWRAYMVDQVRAYGIFF